MGKLLNVLITISKYESEKLLIVQISNVFYSLSLPHLFCCSDGARVALKIIKNIDRYREAAMSEVEVLEKLKSLDSERR